MTDLEELAQDTADVFLANDSAGITYKLQSRQAVTADDIGTDDFPRFGDFVPVYTEPPSGSDGWQEDCYLEVPRGLAAILVGQDVEAGDVFRIETVQKSDDGEWTYIIDSDVDDPVDG